MTSVNKPISIRKSDFEEVSVYWRKLWDSRYQFMPTSSMMYLGGYDGSIPKKYAPVFFAAICDSKVAGVVSCHKSSDDFIRLRGLFVEDEYRGHGVSSLLIETVIEHAKGQRARLLWATPRQVSLPIFQKLGFTQDSDFTHEGFLFGPNCYVSLKF